MKRIVHILILFFIFGCRNQPDPILGDWKMSDRFTRANYRIQEEDGSLNALVLSYSDGTTRYRFDSTDFRYFLKNLKKENEKYVDGVSGATEKNATNRNLSIKIKHIDTLEVTTHILNQPLIEIWTRTSK